MNIYEKLLNIQNELKAPKNLYNKFGDYNYRSAEGILEAVKPLCHKYKAVLRMTDELEEKGTAIYLKAIAELIDVERETYSPEDHYAIGAQAYARIPDMKKGMDVAQLSGAASSYARKYALNALFAIDDNKDSDGLPPENETRYVKTEGDETLLLYPTFDDAQKFKTPQKWLRISGFNLTQCNYALAKKEYAEAEETLKAKLGTLESR